MVPDFHRLVVEANKAPSVHNTQPTQWRLDGDGIELSLNPARLLTYGDPTGRDARLSLGAALEGTMIALAAQGHGVRGVDVAATGRIVARVAIGAQAAPDPDAAFVAQRITWRGDFAPATSVCAVSVLCQNRNDAIWVGHGPEMQALASWHDTASLRYMRDAAFRSELLHWMRLHRSHARFALDGLNYPALGMRATEAALAGIVLRRPLFEALGVVGLAAPLVAERTRTLGAAGVVLFHRPMDEDPVQSGRAYYRLLLGLTRLDLAAWPMAALSDDPETRAEVCRLVNLADDRQLIQCLRVGAIPTEAPRPAPARLEPSALLTM